MRPTNTFTLLTLFLGFLLLRSSAFGSTVSSRSSKGRYSALRRTVSESNSYGSFPLGKRAITPAIPTVADCQAQLTVPANKAVFYSSDVQPSADTYAEVNGMVTIWTAGLTAYQTTLEDQIDQAEKDGLDTWQIEDYDTFWSNASKAFALLAAGTVTVVLPAGQDRQAYFPAGSKWTTIEYPVLTDSSQNSAVTSILALTGTDQEEAPGGEPTKIWPC